MLKSLLEADLSFLLCRRQEAREERKREREEGEGGRNAKRVTVGRKEGEREGRGARAKGERPSEGQSTLRVSVVRLLAGKDLRSTGNEINREVRTNRQKQKSVSPAQGFLTRATGGKPRSSALAKTRVLEP